MSHTNHREQTAQAGFSTFASIAAIIAIGVVFLSIFLFSLGSTKRPTATTEGSNAQQTAQSPQADETAKASASKEAPYIRIPENSEIYNDTKYKFMFAYPNSFGALTESTVTGSRTDVFRTESGLADQKPVGAGTAFLNGRLGAYVYNKAEFKLIVGSSELYVAPTKTGNDTTWKVVSRDSAASNSDVSVGDAYPVQSTKSQTGITVFDFALNTGNRLLGRWVFESGDHYILIALPLLTKPSNTPLTDQDIATYTIIGTNIAKTVRIPASD